MKALPVFKDSSTVLWYITLFRVFLYFKYATCMPAFSWLLVHAFPYIYFFGFGLDS